ncbi:porin [Litorivicinus sp.]|nr:porin [Litorivicinus sp.]
MKKIIAVAVAAAFAVPAYADINVSGQLEFQYKAADGVDNVINDDGQLLSITGSSKLNNGMSVGADMTFDLGGGSDGGESINIKGDFGSFSMGDVSGALDSVGDYSDVSPEEGGFSEDGNDAGVLVSTKLGTATVYLSHSPTGASDLPGGITADFNSYSIKMPVGPAEVYVGAESHGAASATQDVIAYGVKSSFGGVMVAAEYADYDSGASATGLAATYSMGDIKLAIESQTTQTAADVTNMDETILSATYNMGGGLKVYVESRDDSATGVTDGGINTFGMQYSF